VPTPPIIIIKKKGGHGGHHGGAWKVTYADFVTAMMALFIVLWLMNSSQKIQVAVGGQFKDPLGNRKTTRNRSVRHRRELPFDQAEHGQAQGGVAKKYSQHQTTSKSCAKTWR
jgi:flagellar motor protein MotB